jgi:hypothetical protein
LPNAIYKHNNEFESDGKKCRTIEVEKMTSAGIDWYSVVMTGERLIGRNHGSLTYK